MGQNQFLDWINVHDENLKKGEKEIHGTLCKWRITGTSDRLLEQVMDDSNAQGTVVNDID